MDILQDLYPNPPIPLDHTNTFTFLIAVLLSARTTDKMVNKVTPVLFQLADNPYDMKKLSVEQIREIIKPVGLSPQKAKAIKRMAYLLLGQVVFDESSIYQTYNIFHAANNRTNWSSSWTNYSVRWVCRLHEESEAPRRRWISCSRGRNPKH